MTLPSTPKGKRKWRLTRINDGYKMTRVEGNEIAVRDLKWWERIVWIRRKP